MEIAGTAENSNLVPLGYRKNWRMTRVKTPVNSQSFDDPNRLKINCLLGKEPLSVVQMTQQLLAIGQSHLTGMGVSVIIRPELYMKNPI